jgi:hypothetical protein
LSIEAFQELQQVTQLLVDTPITEGATDQRSFVWGEKYTPASFYKFMFGQLPKDIALNAIWKSRTLPKLKVFLWLLMMDRLNTRDFILRKHWHLDSGPDCLLCSGAVLETRDHLFFSCDFAQHCWEFLSIQWDMHKPFSESFISAWAAFGGPCFMEVVACAAWNIWRVRNDIIFKGIPASFNRWKVRFQGDLFLHKYKVKSSSVQPLVEWLTSLFI